MDISDLARDLFEKMTERDPKLRLNIADIKAHPWLNGEILDEELLCNDIEERGQGI
jgi:serine/threonine protein kinase